MPKPDKPGKKPRKKVAKKKSKKVSQDQTIADPALAKGGLDKTVSDPALARGNLDQTIQDPGNQDQTIGDPSLARGNLDQTIQDPDAGGGLGATLKDGMNVSAQQPGGKATAGNLDATLQQTGAETYMDEFGISDGDAEPVNRGAATVPKPPKIDTAAATLLSDVPQIDSAMLDQTIQEKWGDSLDDENNLGLSIKTDRQTKKQKSSIHVSVKSRVFSSTDEGDASAPARSIKTDGSGADYELIEVLGEGGMGVIYTARQTSVDRTIAIKMIKSNVSLKGGTKEKFLAEAAVTADLDHPNIVPVYDLGSNDNGDLFYAMKKVKGQPWNETIGDKTLTENIDYLFRVCDAMAFAHDKGIVHRDLKPENVMLGGYGEVLVMDWGLAAAVSPEGKADLITDANACCGTPCYMAPEMAYGLADTINKWSDIYLLGAILYEIVTGLPPHTGKDVMDCLKNAAFNKIQPTPMDNELLDIAMVAMATKPTDRYGSVVEFQDAVKKYQEHFESTSLCNKARSELESAVESLDYSEFARALYGFQEARSLWSENQEAIEGESEARLLYATCAMEKEDFDLANSLLLKKDESHVELKKEAVRSLKEQNARKRRLKVLTYGFASGAAVFVVVLCFGVFYFMQKEKQALELKNEADKKKAEAIQQKKEADEAKQQAVDSAEKAKASEKLAKDKEAEAKVALKKAEDANVRANEETKKANEALEKVLVEQEKARKAEIAKKEAEEKFRYRIKIQENTWWLGKANKQAEAGMPINKTVSLPGGAELPFVVIPPGNFGMGSHADEPDRIAEEHLHEVAITKPIYMGKYEITRKVWQAIMKKLPAGAEKLKEVTPEHPVTHVNWESVQKEFLPELQKHIKGFKVRLPTEAEWEYACRAGTNTPVNTGKAAEAMQTVGWYRANSGRKSHPVGKKLPNSWGLFDMHGNVGELCVDEYDIFWYRSLSASEATKDPVKAGDGVRRVYRGGGWVNSVEQCRSAYRSWVHIKNEHEYIGFRVVLEKE